MSTATQGRSREYQVRDAMAAAGWVPIMRAAASKGAGDLLMGHPVRGGALVQVGTESKRLGPADRERFVYAADLIAAIPVLAVVVPRRGITYWWVDLGSPAGWELWKP